MIDLHIHTTFSDGSDSCIEVLKKCEEKKLEYISITDHNTAKAYNELENSNIRNLYNGHIITGIELNTKILGIPIEILGYGIDYKKMNLLVDNIYISPNQRNLIETNRLYEKCKKYGIILDEQCLENYSPETFTSVYFHTQITKNPINKKLLSSEAWDSSRTFYRQYMSDPKMPLYVEMDDFVPDFETASNLIRECNGLVFIPHIHEYKSNALKILDYILNNHKIDGIECFYTTFSNEQTNNLIDLCNERNLFISGGSDYHGKYKPDVDIGIGHGNLKISDSNIENWKHIVKTI